MAEIKKIMASGVIYIVERMPAPGNPCVKCGHRTVLNKYWVCPKCCGSYAEWERTFIKVRPVEIVPVAVSRKSTQQSPL